MEHSGFWHRRVLFIDLAWALPALAATVFLGLDTANGQAVGPFGLWGAVMVVLAGIAFLHARMVRLRDQTLTNHVPPDDKVVDDIKDIWRRRDEDR